MSKLDSLKVKQYIDLIPESFVYSLAFNPTGEMLASGREDKSVIIYETKNFKDIKQLNHSDNVTSLTWSSDGKYLVSGSSSGPIKLWDTSDWTGIMNLPKSKASDSLSWSSNGNYLAAGIYSSKYTKGVSVWNTKDWSFIETKNDCNPVYVSFNPDSTMLALDYELKGIEILDTKNFSRIALLDFSDSKEYVNIYSPSWNANGSLIAACCGDGRIRVWSTKDWSEVITLKLHEYWKQGIYKVAFNPTDNLLVSSGFGEPKLIRTDTWDIIYTFKKGIVADFYSHSWHPSGKFYAFAAYGGSPIEIWKIIF